MDGLRRVDDGSRPRLDSLRPLGDRESDVGTWRDQAWDWRDLALACDENVPMGEIWASNLELEWRRARSRLKQVIDVMRFVIGPMRDDRLAGGLRFA